MKKFLKTYPFIIVSLFLFATKVAAQQYVPGSIENPINRNSIPEVLDDLFSAISEIGAILLAIMIVYSGFLFVTAGGNDAKLQKAKDSIKYVIIGGAIVLGASGIAKLIEQTLTG